MRSSRLERDEASLLIASIDGRNVVGRSGGHGADRDGNRIPAAAVGANEWGEEEVRARDQDE